MGNFGMTSRKKAPQHEPTKKVGSKPAVEAPNKETPAGLFGGSDDDDDDDIFGISSNKKASNAGPKKGKVGSKPEPIKAPAKKASKGLFGGSDEDDNDDLF